MSCSSATKPKCKPLRLSPTPRREGSSNKLKPMGNSPLQGRALSSAPRTEKDNKSRERPPLQNGEGGEECFICGILVEGYEHEFCCSGIECGCMGLPINPCTCSKQCDKALFDNIGHPMEERRVIAGIPWRGGMRTSLQNAVAAATTEFTIAPVAEPSPKLPSGQSSATAGKEGGS